MSDGFRDREKSFEAKHKLDEELRFKAEVRRDKLVGLWAAAKMGLTGGEAEAYAKAVVVSDMDEPGVNDMVRKVMADFAERGVKVAESELRAEIDRQWAIAVEQVKEDFEPLGGDHN